MEEHELLERLGLKNNPFVIEVGGEWETVWSENCWKKFTNSISLHKTVAITGEIGIGKTTFIREVVKRFKSENKKIKEELKIGNDQVEHLLYYQKIPEKKKLMYDLASTIKYDVKVSLLDRLLRGVTKDQLVEREIEHLIEKTGDELILIQKTVNIVLIFDEAQDSVKESEETMRYLRSFSDEAGQRRIVFIGLPRLTEQITEGSLRSRIIEKEFPTLTKDEVREVVKKRLQKSMEKNTLDDVFSDDIIGLLCNNMTNVRDILQRGNRFLSYLCSQNLVTFGPRDVEEFITKDTTQAKAATPEQRPTERKATEDRLLISEKGYDFKKAKKEIDGLTDTEVNVLILVAKNPNLTQKEIAEMLDITKQAASKHLTKLEDAKVLVVFEDEQDKRRKVYRLSREFELKVISK